VDGSYNAIARHQRLDWLKEPTPPLHCRVLSNARCLSEGVDVPSLDAVMFLNPRNSVVDVVQSVGRVMRKAPGKNYGYIILPIGIPAGIEPSEALKAEVPPLAEGVMGRFSLILSGLHDFLGASF
jgi:predicted helicase